MNISIREIEYVLAVAREESISKAAQKLNISQPALSQAILKIEATIGIPLFFRTKSGFSLTETGDVFVKYGTEILKSLSDIENDLQQRKGASRGKLRVGIPYYLSSQFMPPVLNQFQALCPDVQVALTELSSRDLETELLQRRVNVAIIPLPLQLPGIAYKELVSSRMCVYFSASDPILQQTYEKPGEPGRYIDLFQLKDASFIMLNSGQRTATVAKIMLNNVQIDPKISFLTKNFNTLKRLVSNGLGVAIAPAVYISSAQEKALRLCRAYLEESQDFPWSVVAAYEESRHLSDVTQCFIDVVSQCWDQSSGKRPFD